ncbi:unnamed protein product [Staurois parvus]|uniref:Uncharacterized protein n=1 Tax=Staurois parvus TaxID=386267 RepID=A0ABN9CE52_9NEOB|nr:unnamed protein product [Staurois parvus]
MILTLLTPAPAICTLQTLTCQLSSFSGHSLARASLIFALLLGSSSSLVIGSLCASPELQFWRPITGEEAELLSEPGDVAR